MYLQVNLPAGLQAKGLGFKVQGLGFSSVCFQDCPKEAAKAMYPKQVLPSKPRDTPNFDPTMALQVGFRNS